MSLMAIIDYALILVCFLVLGLLVLLIGHSHTRTDHTETEDSPEQGNASTPLRKQGEENKAEIQHHGQ